MKKIFLTLGSALLLSANFNVNAQTEADYTVPSWTLYQRALVEAQNVLVANSQPYNVNVVINGDPKTQMAATWFTNAGVTGGKLQLVEGAATGADAFSAAREINASSTDINDLMYVSSGNNNNELVAKTGFAKGVTRSYTSNKALIDGLTPGTIYSYRVGGINNSWSAIGTFTTAKDSKEPFDFIYATDTQANTDEMFDISKKTIERAYQDIPTAKFLLINGDLVETAGNSNSEWEWEQWFEKMQSAWLQLPIVPVQGNHDTSGNSNMFHHFNTDKSFNAVQADNTLKTAMEGTVYSFVYGDALFMVVNYEDYGKGEPYFAALETWMEAQIAAHQDVKWRIVTYHKTVFTGSGSHQSDGDGKTVRKRMAKVYDRLGINLALQGHDHIYEVIGPVKVANETTYSFADGSVSSQTVVTPTNRDNVTGKLNGTFDVSEGVLYFLNNSAGKKKYEPRTRAQMDAAIAQHEITNYFDMFSGRFGQTGEPTFSKVSVSTEKIAISTYTVNDAGEATLFDSFEVVKEDAPNAPTEINGASVRRDMIIAPNPASHSITIDVPEEAIENVRIFTLDGSEILSQKSNVVNLASFSEGIYLINAKTSVGNYTERLVVKK